MIRARRVAFALVIAACTASWAQSPYPMFGANAQRTNRVLVEGPQETPDVMWQVFLDAPGSHFSTTPVVDDEGNLYLSAGYTVDGVGGPVLFSYARDGALRWQTSAGTSILRGGLSTPAVRGDLLVLGFRDAALRAIDADTGDVRWTADRAATGGPFISSPVFDPFGGVILAGKLTNGVYRLRADSGDTLWHYAPGGGSGSSPALSPDGRTVYCGREADVRALFALRVSTGAVKWTFATPTLQAGWCSPLVDEQGIIYQQDDRSGEVFALRDRGTRSEVVWRFDTQRPGDAPRLMALAGSILYVATCGPDARLIALRAGDAEPLWTRAFPGSTMLTSPLVTPSTVYIGAHGSGAVYALDRLSGATRWARNVAGPGGSFTDSLSIGTDGTLYCAASGTPEHPNRATLIALHE